MAKKSKGAASRQLSTGSMGERLARTSAAQPTPRQSIRYRFDKTLDKGARAMIGWLLLTAMALSIPFAIIFQFLPATLHGQVIKGATVLTNAPAGILKFFDDFYQTLWIVLGKGQFNSSSWVGRIFAIAGIMCSLLVSSSLFAFISNTVNKRIADLRRGRGKVYESGHIAILGWGPQVYSILQQVDQANANNRGTVVVIANTAKETMDDEIKSRVGELPNTRVVLKYGDPSNPKILAEGSILNAKSIIVAGSSGVTATISIILSVLANIQDLKTIPIIAEINDKTTAKALVESSDAWLIPVRSNALIARIYAHAIRHPGLAAVYLELLDYGGNELYIKGVSEATGRKFGDLGNSLLKTRPIGIYKENGDVLLTPDPNEIIGERDAIIAVAGDDSDFRWTPNEKNSTEVTFVANPMPLPVDAPENILIIGWSKTALKVVKELSALSTIGSKVTIFADTSNVRAEDFNGLEETNLLIKTKGTTGELDELVAMLDSDTFEKIAIFGYENLSDAEADSETLLKMLAIAHLKQQGSVKSSNALLITQIMDSNNVELARIANADDLIISDRLSSLEMSQLAESPNLEKVFAELFDSGGSNIVSRPAHHFVPIDIPVTFGEIAALARSYGEYAVGYREAVHTQKESLSDGIFINPGLNAVLTPTSHTSIVIVSRHHEG